SAPKTCLGVTVTTLPESAERAQVVHEIPDLVVRVCPGEPGHSREADSSSDNGKQLAIGITLNTVGIECDGARQHSASHRSEAVPIGAVAACTIDIVEVLAGSDAHAGFTVGWSGGDYFASGSPSDHRTRQFGTQRFLGAPGLLDGAQVDSRKQRDKAGDGE